MSIATQLKCVCSIEHLTLNDICQRLKKEKVEKMIESVEDGYTTILVIFSDNSKLKITDNNNLYFSEI